MNQSINRGLTPIIVACLLLFAVSANATVKTLPVISRHIDRHTLNDASKKLIYDRLGNLTTLGDKDTTANDQTYSYDPLNRLTDFWAPGTVQHYDPGGNRTVKIHNGATTAYLPETASNRLDTVNATPYSYDHGYLHKHLLLLP